MFISIFLLGLLVLTAIAGLTGIGTYDSRDTRFNLRATSSTSAAPAYENLMSPQCARRGFRGRPSLGRTH